MAQFSAERMMRRLQAAGAPAEMAVAVSDEVDAAISGLATREDVQMLRTELQAMRADFHEALNKQTWRLCGLVGLAAGVAVAIVKLA